MKRRAGLIDGPKTTYVMRKNGGKEDKEEEEEEERGAGLITFPADFTGGREVKIRAPLAHCTRPSLLPPLPPAF